VTKNDSKNYRQLETERRGANSADKTKTTIDDLNRISFLPGKDPIAEISPGK